MSCDSTVSCQAVLTLGAHAQRGLRYLVCVCVSVCSILAPTASELREPEIYNSDFGVLQRYAVKTSESQYA